MTRHRRIEADHTPDPSGGRSRDTARPAPDAAPDDRVELSDGRVIRRPGAGASLAAGGPDRPTPFLMVWFRCCHVYARLARSADATRYEGRCPRCGAQVRARIGDHGTTRRIFEAR
ncbi:MAG: hypothetical protein KF817_11370 [Phycisphaeraceae bacterium]|nr:hypothetical protein [Phycisphaeraceae bacterium]